jgi:hypothetical protein
MAGQPVRFTDEYTRKVSGEVFQYEAEYNTDGAWRARIYQDGELKGTPSGSMVDAVMDGEALHQYIIAYVESIIEKGLGISE